MGRLSPGRSLTWRVGLTVAAAVLLLAACGGGEPGIRVTAATSTPSAGAPASTPTTVLATDDATPVPVPPRPENPFAAGRELEAYLSDGRADLEGCLPEVVSAWSLALEVEGVRCFLADLDGDRTDEYGFLVSFAVDAGPRPSDLWLFQQQDGDWRYFNSGRALANASTAGLHVRAVEDFTGDGTPDITATWEDCDASTCVTHLLLATHHNGALEDLAPGDAMIETLEVFEVQDRTVRMRGGSVASAEAGPQRGATLTVSWAGNRFRLEAEPGEPAYLVHLVDDADRAFARAEYAEAHDRYLQAVQDTSLPDWKQETGQTAGRTELRAYATFRAALAAQREGDELRARALLAQAALDYGGSMHGSIAQEYLLALEDGAQPGEACAAVEVYIEPFQALYVSFWDYGTANPQRTVFTLCR